MRTFLLVALSLLFGVLSALVGAAEGLTTSFRVVPRAQANSQFECQVRIHDAGTHALIAAGSTYVAAGGSTVIRVRLSPDQWLHVNATVDASGKEATFVSEVERAGKRSQRTSQTIPVSAPFKE